MKLFELASNQSFWRGIDYYHDKKVKTWKQIDKNHLEGEVEGSNHHQYHVVVDIKHPKRSSCTCPFAEGRLVVCKHMVALYCEAFPEKEKAMLQLIDEENEKMKQKAEEDRAKHIQWIHKYVMSLSKAELREELLTRMLEDFAEEENPYDW